MNLILQNNSPAVTGFPELISAKTADIPSLGRAGILSELKSGAFGGGGGVELPTVGAIVTAEEDADAETAVPQAGPKG